jgi:hypothetical protein
MSTKSQTHVYVHVASTATDARRARRMLAPTPFGVRGGAVSIDGFSLARDSARTWILMS